MVSAVIFAGGVGARMKSQDIPKQFLIVDGKPIIIRTLEVFSEHPEVDEIVVACLESWIPVLEEQEDYTNDPLFETLSAFVKEHGYKNGYVMWPLRTAVSGKQMTPAGATEIMEIIGKDETIKRVKAAIEKLSK